MAAAANNSSSALPYLGSKLQLISYAGIRYEGVLFNINTRDSTVGLTNVRSYGTEGRKPGAEIPPSDDVYDYIVFRGKDIQDLTVSDPVHPEDPAIVAINPGPPSMHHPAHVDRSYGGGYANHHRGGGPNVMGNHHHGPSGLGAGFNSGGGGGHHHHHLSGLMQQQQQQQQSHHLQQQSHGGRRGGGRSGGARGGGYGGSNYGHPRTIVGELRPQPNQTLKSQLAQAFDFEAGNRRFEKLAPTPSSSTTEGAPNENELSPPVPKAGYNKSASFFDTISCEALDRQSGVDTRVDRQRQREVDAATFGTTAALTVRRGGRGYRRTNYRRPNNNNNNNNSSSNNHHHHHHQHPTSSSDNHHPVVTNSMMAYTQIGVPAAATAAAAAGRS